MVGSEDDQALDRRRFIQSVFGLGGVLEVPSAVAKPAVASSPKFFWADLRTGQIGFPCGQQVPSGMPGSIMKIVATAALVDSGNVILDEKFDCRGTYKIHNEELHCLYPHGMVDLVHALGLSCNCYFAQISKKLSSKIFLSYASSFGLDKNVGTFASGKFPVSALPDSLHYVLGLAADLEPSALQLLRVAALVANKGKLPYLHSAEAPDPNGPLFSIHLTEPTWRVLQQGMQLASREGTGKNLDPEQKMKIAIKTGTTPHGKTLQSWICGYFPFDEPRYAFVLRATAGASQESAVPAAHKFLFANNWP